MSFNWSHDRTRLAGSTLFLAAGAILLAACGGGSSSKSSTATQPPGTQALASPTTTAPSSTGGPASSGPTVMSVSSSAFGPILANSKGLALYTATGDTATKTGCTGTCLKFWPPLLLPAGQTHPVAGPGVTGLGTFMRAGAGLQVTYHGKPLYTWIKDTAQGQVTGNGVVDSGGTWHIATLGGATGGGTASPAPATAPSSPPTTAAPSSGGASF